MTPFEIIVLGILAMIAANTSQSDGATFWWFVTSLGLIGYGGFLWVIHP